MKEKNLNKEINRRQFLIGSSCLLGFLAMPFKKAIAGIPSANGVRLGDYKEKTRFVLDLSHQVEHKIFILENPHRVVVDLPHMNWNIKSNSGKGLIKKYRFGRFNRDTSRLVLDLTHPVIVQDTFVLPAREGKGPRLVIDLKKDKKSNIVKLENDIEDVIASLPKKKEDKKSKYKWTKKVITIDPGHGGRDPGAIGVGGVYEKKLTLVAAKEAKRQLEATGRYKVYLTRYNDKSLKLWSRVVIARKHKSDLFMSLHADALNDKSVRGASVYTLAEKASDARAAKLAARENKADLIFDENLNNQPKEVANILLDLKRRETLNSSKIFANMLISHFRNKGVNLVNNNHRYAAFAVLKAPDVPSVLIEMGFLSNPKEVKLLNTSSYRKKICAAIVRGVDKHFA